MGLSGHYQGPEGEFIDIQANDGQRSCYVAKVFVRNCNEVARGIAKANADLIAAAPDMLAVLRRASYQLATGDDDRLALRHQIDDLIAKVTGEPKSIRMGSL